MIHVIFTGGTIGSTLKDDFISSDNKKKNKLLGFIKEDVISHVPYEILSENLDGDYLNLLINTIKEILKEKPDGIIITHGSDTLHITASMLDIVFNKVDVPIVLVASNYPIEDKRANGIINLNNAISFINDVKEKGVYVSYQNSDKKSYIHRGQFLSPIQEFTWDLFSVSNNYFGIFNNGKFIKNSEFENGALEEINEYKLSKYSDVLLIDSMAGIKYPDPSGYKNVIIKAYHSGTINVNDNLKKFIKACDKLNIKVYLCGLRDDLDHYETVKEYEKLKMEIVYNMSLTTLYNLLWIK